MLSRRTVAKTASIALATSLSIAALAVGASKAEADPPAAPATSAGFLAPYYTKGDITGDGQLTRADLDALGAALGTVSTDAGWSAVSAADYDGDLSITATDVADLSRRLLYDDGPFQLLESDAVEMQKAMNAGVVTSVQLTQAYLDRIAAYDKLTDDTHSRALNSIITASSVALEAAAASDAARAANGGPRSMVDGIPILLKDNYDTKDMPTTAGCGCWDANQTSDDAFMVNGLRSDGAIILGKATLDEFAFGFVSEYSSYLPSGTSKLVASPYRLASTAGGSSGGTGASIAANLGAIGFGTDTGGSIRVPSSYNQLVGIRPTVGLASRDGIVPLALSQDTGGPIARSVTDAAIALDSVTGVDPNDPVTSGQSGKVPTSYTSYLDPKALTGKKFGYVASMVPTSGVPKRLFDQAVAKLTELGATVSPITIPNISATLNEGSGSTSEMKHDLDIYIANHLNPGVTANTMQGIIDSGRYVPSRLSTFNQRKVITPTQYASWMASHTNVINTSRATVTAAMDEGAYDALIYPSAGVYTTIGTNLRLSPNTGLPAVSIPMGQTIAADNSALGTGLGVNLEFLGRAYDEGKLIGLTYAYEQATKWRTAPSLYPALAPAAPPVSPTVAAAPASVEPYTVTVDDNDVKIGDTVEITVATTGATDLYAYDLDLGFDASKLSYVAGSATTDISGATYVDETGSGDLHVVHTKLGTSPATTGQATLVKLKFKAKKDGTATVTADGIRKIATDLTTSTESTLGSVDVAVALLDPAVATTDPLIEGNSLPGGVMTAKGGTWDLDGVTLGYQWLLDGLPIANATGTSYTVKKVDVGHKLSVRVTASLEDHADGVATSNKVAVTKFGTTIAVFPLKGKVNKKPGIVVATGALFGPKVTGAIDVYYAGVLIKDELVLNKGTAGFLLPAKSVAGSYPLKVVLHPTGGTASASKTFTFKVVR
ncbi:Asp-tRNA(Asn)/Glu-tRNA(Gln) amidotransferase A subunit family amidase [Marmoricola sp. OAE513]|uniref:amidase family protein n=1 Tax=Marmoricola sp. OAE513 TaxID=2817894 RepID=UPI001AE361C1